MTSSIGFMNNDVTAVVDAGTTKGMTTTAPPPTLHELSSSPSSSLSSSPPLSLSQLATTITTQVSSTLASTTKIFNDTVTSLTNTTSSTRTTTTTAAAATTAELGTTTSQTMASSLPTSLTTTAATTTTTTTIMTTTLNASELPSISTISYFTNSTAFQNQTFTGSTSESPLNISDQEREAYLAYLQNQTTREMIPAMTYLIILAVVGLIGNSLVLFVYSRKYRKTATRVFIMSIAGFDLVTNIVVIPAEIYDMFHIWDFNQPILCKTRLFFNAFTTMVAAIVLVAVAVVRYRKICTPFAKQVSIKLAKILSVGITIFSLVFSVPYAIINGRQTRPTPRPGIHGYECTIDDSYVDTIWPMVNSGFFVLLFFSCCGPLVILYICIGVKAWKHSKVYGVAGGSKEGHDSTTNNSTSGMTDTGTKSTDDTHNAPVRFNMSTRTKSYVKKQTDDTDHSAPAPSRVGSEKQNGKAKKGKKSLRKKENSKKKANADGDDDDDGGENNTDDANVIEYATDESADNKANATTTTAENAASSTTANNNNYSARMIRSPMGDKVQINLNMVRELTVKLKAVQKESEKRNDEKKDEEENGEGNDEHQDNDSKRVKFRNEQSDDDQGVVDDIPDTKTENEEVALRHDKDKKTNQDGGKTSQDKTSKASTKTDSKHKRTLSKSMDDIFRLTSEVKGKGKQRDGKTKAAENEDLDLPTPANESTDNKEEDDGHSPSQEEPMSDFAKAMQWVDITYCLKENKRDSANMDNDNAEDKEPQNVGKKTSFSISRKVSRDNSFLQRHRKLRDTLTDTLTRARKNKRDRELAEAENGNTNGSMDDNTNTMNNDEENDTLQNTNDEETTVSFKPNERKASRFFKFKEDKSTNDPKERSRSIGGGTRRRGLGRTTCMLICISAVYIIGFLPFLALMFIKAASPGTFEMLDPIPQSLYYLFLRSYFLNCAANPIVYSLCDASFRRECFKLLKCSWCQRRIY